MSVKKLLLLFVLTALLMSCNKTKRSPGRAYMPDMAYSRTYETYAALDSAKFTNSLEEIGEGKIFYNAMPVPGTVARGSLPNIPLTSDSAGILLSMTITNPLPPLDSLQMKEAERLYLVNCGICHGTKLDGKGPLFNSGAFAAAPRNLMEPAMKESPAGRMFHAVTFGQGQMGSYASQLSTKQRWMVIHYVKAKQGSGGADSTNKSSTMTAGATKDSVAK
jgi:mono/diheme cytochrome c family protein